MKLLEVPGIISKYLKKFILVVTAGRYKGYAYTRTSHPSSLYVTKRCGDCGGKRHLRNLRKWQLGFQNILEKRDV